MLQPFLPSYAELAHGIPMACTPFSEQATVCEYVGQSSTSLCVQRCKVNIAIDPLSSRISSAFRQEKEAGHEVP